MPIMIGNRDDRVTTLTGHVVSFKAGEESFVPDNTTVIKACLERGHALKKDEPVKAEPKVAPKVEPKTEK